MISGLSTAATSTVNRIGTQLVRYDTGDLAIAPSTSCTNHFLRVGSIVAITGDLCRQLDRPRETAQALRCGQRGVVEGTAGVLAKGTGAIAALPLRG